jgi:hypothetical protein
MCFQESDFCLFELNGLIQATNGELMSRKLEKFKSKRWNRKLK